MAFSTNGFTEVKEREDICCFLEMGLFSKIVQVLEEQLTQRMCWILCCLNGQEIDNRERDDDIQRIFCLLHLNEEILDTEKEGFKLGNRLNMLDVARKGGIVLIAY